MGGSKLKHGLEKSSMVFDNIKKNQNQNETNSEDMGRDKGILDKLHSLFLSTQSNIRLNFSRSILEMLLMLMIIILVMLLYSKNT